MSDYFHARPAISSYIERVRDKAKVTRKVVTHFGRIQSVPEFWGDTRSLKNKAERASVNRIIQGTGADIIKIAMIRMAKLIASRFKPNAMTMRMTSHDALEGDFDPALTTKEEAIKAILDAMVFPIKGYPLISVTIKMGPSWGELKEVWGKKEWLNCPERLIPGDALVWGDTISAQKQPEEAKPVVQEQPKPAELKPAEPKPIETIIIKPSVDLTRGMAETLKITLIKHPGLNTVVIHMGEGKLPVSLTNYKTSLGHEDKELFQSIIPSDVFLEKSAVPVADLLKGMKA